MPITGFLKIPDIAGESVVSDHEGEIEVHGLSWGLRRATAAAPGGGGRPGKAEADPLTVLKFFDRASPFLAQAVLSGQRFDEIRLTVSRIAGGAPFDYLRITARDCLLTDYQMENGGPDDPLTQISEAVEIRAENIEIRYTVQADDGSAGGQHQVKLDLAEGA